MYLIHSCFFSRAQQLKRHVSNNTSLDYQFSFTDTPLKQSSNRTGNLTLILQKNLFNETEHSSVDLDPEEASDSYTKRGRIELGSI